MRSAMYISFFLFCVTLLGSMYFHEKKDEYIKELLKENISLKKESIRQLIYLNTLDSINTQLRLDIKLNGYKSNNISLPLIKY